MKKSIFIGLSIVCLNNLSWAQTSSNSNKVFKLNTITTAVPFLIIAPDSRAGGMGDAGVATSGDANSFYWNTSKLVFAKPKAGISASYSPWLRGIAHDIKLLYLTGYKKIGNKHVIGGSIRYFSLGNITFTNSMGVPTTVFNPNEFEVLAGYALKLSDNMSVGINAKFIYSNLTRGILQGPNTPNAGLAGAADLSFSYLKPDLSLGGYLSTLAFGLNISNMGNKMSYTSQTDRDFIPTNLRLGTALAVNFNKNNKISIALDINKLLVPTLPLRDPNTPWGIISGKENNIGVVQGMLQSFYDAPGIIIGTSALSGYSVVKGSRLKEELSEINIGCGLEYSYRDKLAFRTGYFHESPTKGNRRYLTFGAGLKAYSFGLDLAYLVSMTQNNPLANTIRFSLSYRLTQKKVSQIQPV